MAQHSRPGFRSRLGGLLLLGLAATALLIAVVWSTGSASDGDGVSGTTDTVAAEEQVNADTAVDSVPVTESSIANLSSEELAARVAALENTVAELRALLDATGTAMAEVIGKTSQLNADGTYSGAIAPRQISPQLKVTDVAGKWPLERSDGDLSLSRVDIGFTSCRSDSRFYGVITVGSFRQLECVKIPK